jgi:hypothetical protein
MYGWLPENCDDASQVVTASRRLARLLTLLTAEYNAQQLASGKRAWLTPVIVALPDWLSRLLASAGLGRQPARLEPHASCSRSLEKAARVARAVRGMRLRRKQS